MMRVTIFAQSVYQVVRKIPRGKVSTYALVAEAVGHPGAARAVGNALHNNPTPGPVPCHRVVRSSGDIGGYVHGRQTKQALLLAEGVPVNSQGRVISLTAYLKCKMQISKIKMITATAGSRLPIKLKFGGGTVQNVKIDTGGVIPIPPARRSFSEGGVEGSPD